MPRIVRHPRLYRAVTALMLMVVVQGCTHWAMVPLEPQRLTARQDVRVTLATGDRQTLRGAYVARDSLVSSSAQPIPLARVRGIELRTVDGAATGAVVATGVVALAVIAVVALTGALRGVGDIGCVPACN